MTDAGPVPPATLETALTLGDGLRAHRERLGLSLAEVAKITKVPARYLIAIEQNDFSVLPSRVFASGYVRSFAGAVGASERLAVERFQAESPDGTVPLQAPAGVRFQDVRQLSPRFFAALALIGVLVVGWNIFQRVTLNRAPKPSDIAEIPASWAKTDIANQRSGLQLGEALPAPPDQSLPDPYVTKGLEAQLGALDPITGEPVATGRPAAAAPRTFHARGTVTGASANRSIVLLQARKPVSLIVRSGDVVHYAAQLSTGDAWRAPLGLNATVEVSDASGVDVYFNNTYGGGLTGTETTLASLTSRAQGAARLAAAQAQSARVDAARGVAPATVDDGAAPLPPVDVVPATAPAAVPPPAG